MVREKHREYSRKTTCNVMVKQQQIQLIVLILFQHAMPSLISEPFFFHDIGPFRLEMIDLKYFNKYN